MPGGLWRAVPTSFSWAELCGERGSLSLPLLSISKPTRHLKPAEAHTVSLTACSGVCTALRRHGRKRVFLVLGGGGGWGAAGSAFCTSDCKEDHQGSPPGRGHVTCGRPPPWTSGSPSVQREDFPPPATVLDRMTGVDHTSNTLGSELQRSRNAGPLSPLVPLSSQHALVLVTYVWFVAGLPSNSSAIGGGRWDLLYLDHHHFPSTLNTLSSM